jgi:hypothetical protein
MIETKEKEFTNALNELSQTIALIGMKKTIEALKDVRNDINKRDSQKAIVKVIKAVVSVFGDNCLDRKTDDNNKAARCLFVYFLNEYKISVVEISDILKIHRNSVYRLISYLETLNLNNPKAPIEILVKEGKNKIIKQLN